MRTELFNRLHPRALVLAAVACVLVACGVDQVAGIQGTGSPVAAGVTSSGPITGFGSIFQDGVEYATTSAQIRIDDQTALEPQLRVGQIVVIRGTLNPDGKTGSATEVTFSANLRGPVSQIDVNAGTFKVLGQVVRVTGDTVFDEAITPAVIDSLLAGAAVQVSGVTNAAGEVIASRIDVAGAAAGLQVKGKVQSLDTVAHTFLIGSLTVDYSGVTPNGTLANASTVIVRGTAFSNGGALIATQVQVLGSLTAVANDRGRVEGLITAFTSTADFTVDRQRVVTDGTTQLNLDGVTLGVDVLVKVRGTFNASGALLASQVDVKKQGSNRVVGLVDAVSSSAGTLTVLGVSATTNDGTAFEDKSSQKVRTFKLADVRTGDYVEVRGAVGSSGPLVATRVEREPPDTRSYLTGVARDVVTPGFSVLGVGVMTDANTHFIGLGGQARSAVEFFSEASGKIVEVRGTLAGNVLVADRVKIKN